MNIANSAKSCPLCGCSPEISHGMREDYCTCKNESCQLYGVRIVFKDWQSRPREDELESLIADLALRELPNLRELREKLAQKDEYALRLLCESTRVWVCENCGEEFSMKYKGDWVIDGTPITRMDCPKCDSQNSCELKSAVLERKISKLEEIRSSWEFVARKITSITNHEIPFSAANAELVERIKLIDQILFEVTGKK